MNECIKTKYEHFISLGYFCSVALELERYGLRDGSYPFDWCISDIKGVFELINNNFESYTDYNLLEQNSKEHNHYRNKKYNVQFFHDFDEYTPLENQMHYFVKKYERRIKRFYKSISDPTLFVRYISSENMAFGKKSEELAWLEDNYEYIISTLKKFNSKNEIIFISNTDLVSDKIKIFYVQKDDEDVVARKPFEKNVQLTELMDNIDYPKRIENLNVYNKKQKIKNNLINRANNKLKRFLKKLFFKEYIHFEQYK